MQFRAESVVPERMKEMTRCIQERDFQGFAQLTMKDSNQFHATCLDTFPPISYLNDTSRAIIQLVHRFNTHYGQTKVTRRGHEGMQAEARSVGKWWGYSICGETRVLEVDRAVGGLQGGPLDHGRCHPDKLPLQFWFVLCFVSCLICSQGASSELQAELQAACLVAWALFNSQGP